VVVWRQAAFDLIDPSERGVVRKPATLMMDQIVEPLRGGMQNEHVGIGFLA
jgi:hypothetical protein